MRLRREILAQHLVAFSAAHCPMASEGAHTRPRACAGCLAALERLHVSRERLPCANREPALLHPAAARRRRCWADLDGEGLAAGVDADAQDGDDAAVDELHLRRPALLQEGAGHPEVLHLRSREGGGVGEGARQAPEQRPQRARRRAVTRGGRGEGVRALGPCRMRAGLRAAGQAAYGRPVGGRAARPHVHTREPGHARKHPHTPARPHAGERQTERRGPLGGTGSAPGCMRRGRRTRAGFPASAPGRRPSRPRAASKGCPKSSAGPAGPWLLVGCDSDGRSRDSQPRQMQRARWPPGTSPGPPDETGGPNWDGENEGVRRGSGHAGTRGGSEREQVIRKTWV